MNSHEILKYFKNPALLSETTLSGLEHLVQEYPWFQAGWILYAKNLRILNRDEYISVLQRVAIMVPDRRWLKNYLEGNVGKEKNAGVSEEYQIPDVPANDVHSGVAERSGKSRLIEDFLEKGATFTMASEGQDRQPVDLAANAVAINDEIVTEKFANLLIRQKKFGDAIQALQKLVLKFPEKSIYFAARIEEVNILMNVNK